VNIKSKVRYSLIISYFVHGLHVLIGTLFLSVALSRMIAYHFTDHHHVGLEVSILYWHFVDVVWLFLYACVYLWAY